MKFIVPITVLLMLSLAGNAQLPKLASGTLKRFENFSSKYVSARNVDVWLPDGYSKVKKYAVLYMHDGQMLFDSALTWNKQSWDVDDVLTGLKDENVIRDVIVVAIWNTSSRHTDYFPQKPFDYLSHAEKDTVSARLKQMGATKKSFQPQSDNYLKFIVKELKPFIDKNFSTYTNKENTFIMGSSMGGLISMYAICEYPNVFGGAACLSTHWPGTFNMDNNPVPDAFLKYLDGHLPPPKNHKLYFDCGDQTLDAFYPPMQKKADEIIAAKGYTDKNWKTKYFPGENHSEEAWHNRLYIPLVFLLNK
ncbi:MAG: alpha/beta hydrolase [Sphingobacteriales bacterium]|nr:alpha/beta hydrolase [Sphingobacteriales bacterium]MBI3720425.1 alpha/beta hydrolase [Sphingobacteriales bacterium]